MDKTSSSGLSDGCELKREAEGVRGYVLTRGSVVFVYEASGLKYYTAGPKVAMDELVRRHPLADQLVVCAADIIAKAKE